MLTLALNLLGVAVLVALGLGYASSVARRQPSATGDPLLAGELDRLASRRTRRLAAAVVDLGDRPSTRSAFVRSDPATRFEIGSVTKALTGLILADAIERGEVTLDTQVGKVVAELSSVPVAEVTLRELCTHSSGLPRLAPTSRMLPRLLLYGVLGCDPYRGTSTADLLSAAARQRLRSRGRYRYSNLGGAVLGQLLARAAGRDFDQLLAERILEPLGMSGAGVSRADATAAWGWSSIGLPRMPWLMGGYAPAGGVFATLPDLTALAEALLDGTAPGLAALVPVTDQGENRRVGTFWVVDTVPGTERQMVWHNGATGGYSAFVALFPQARRAVVVVANTARPREMERFATGLARWLASRPREA
ncbi:MAG: serine hydrolase domain-containing protein [Terracoccus sp.]